jgi:hypothetical protein
LKLGLFFFRLFESAEGLLSWRLHRRAQVLLTPLPDLVGRNRLQCFLDTVLCGCRNHRPHCEQQAGKPTMGLVLFEPFEFANHGFNDLTAAEQAFLGRGLAGFLLDGHFNPVAMIPQVLFPLFCLPSEE